MLLNKLLKTDLKKTYSFGIYRLSKLPLIAKKHKFVDLKNLAFFIFKALYLSQISTKVNNFFSKHTSEFS